MKIKLKSRIKELETAKANLEKQYLEAKKQADMLPIIEKELYAVSAVLGENETLLKDLGEQNIIKRVVNNMFKLVRKN